MFKFDFDIEDEDGISDTSSQPVQPTAESDRDERPFVEHSLAKMIENLADEISYSSVQAGGLCIPRRDLFDVRMQLISAEGGRPNEAVDAQTAIDFIERPSDLVPRVYEGGLKTWECSIDLAAYLAREGYDARGKRVLELGCGTSMPTLALLHHLFNRPPLADDGPITTIHLQDYNASVLEYVTLPNIVLAWFFSSAGQKFRSTVPPPPPKDPIKRMSKLQLDSVPEEDEETDARLDVPAMDVSCHVVDPSIPGDLSISLELRAAFLASLKALKIDIRLFSGPWSQFRSRISTPYDLVLTSETIYQPASLRSLVQLLRDGSGSGDCLVAAKLVYFGVGGGILEFQRTLGEVDFNGRAETVWEHKEGVGRVYVRMMAVKDLEKLYSR
ncbi:histidine protein methyltransferase [Ceratobasidium sp. AG-Ba]|nr:histidine protein methyltransferase [Ceratobasidium sp. AG-Ba]